MKCEERSSFGLRGRMTARRRRHGGGSDSVNSWLYYDDRRSGHACGNLCVLGDIDDSKIVRMRPPLAQSDSELQ